MKFASNFSGTSYNAFHGTAYEVSPISPNSHILIFSAYFFDLLSPISVIIEEPVQSELHIFDSSFYRTRSASIIWSSASSHVEIRRSCIIKTNGENSSAPGYATITCREVILMDISASMFKGKGHTSMTVETKSKGSISSLNETFGDFSNYCSIYLRFNSFRIKNHCLVNTSGNLVGIEAYSARVDASECLITRVNVHMCIQVISVNLYLTNSCFIKNPYGYIRKIGASTVYLSSIYADRRNDFVTSFNPANEEMVPKFEKVNRQCFPYIVITKDLKRPKRLVMAFFLVNSFLFLYFLFIYFTSEKNKRKSNRRECN